MDTTVPQLLTSHEVADMLRITEDRLRALRSHGEGPDFIKLPTGSVRYTLDAVTAWIGVTR